MVQQLDLTTRDLSRPWAEGVRHRVLLVDGKLGRHLTKRHLLLVALPALEALLGGHGGHVLAQPRGRFRPTRPVVRSGPVIATRRR